MMAVGAEGERRGRDPAGRPGDPGAGAVPPARRAVGPDGPPPLPSPREDDAALARMAGIAFLFGLAAWVGLALLVF